MTATVLPNRRLLNLEVATVLRAATGKKGEFGRVPDLAPGDLDDEGQLISPYFVVYARPGVPEYDNFARTACMAEYPYQITSVGQTDEQAQWMADLCRQALLERKANGDFLHTVATADAGVRNAYAEELGGPEPGGGGLHQVVDIINLEVEAVG